MQNLMGISSYFYGAVAAPKYSLPGALSSAIVRGIFDSQVNLWVGTGLKVQTIGLRVERTRLGLKRTSPVAVKLLRIFFSDCLLVHGMVNG